MKIKSFISQHKHEKQSTLNNMKMTINQSCNLNWLLNNQQILGKDKIKEELEVQRLLQEHKSWRWTAATCLFDQQKRWKKQHITPHASLGIVISTSPMYFRVIGFITLDKAAAGYKYILVIIDQLSRYAQAHAITNKSETATAENLFSDFCWDSERHIEYYMTKATNSKKSAWKIKGIFWN